MHFPLPLTQQVSIQPFLASIKVARKDLAGA